MGGGLPWEAGASYPAADRATPAVSELGGRYVEGEMARGAWYVYAVLLWLFLAALAVQIFLAGMGLAGLGSGDMEAHIGLGWTLHLPVLLILVAALLARVGRPTIWWVLVFFVIGAIQPILATMDAVPLIAALHPLGAVLLTIITVKLALDTLPRLRTAGPEG
jgi:hypothetical protein